VAAVIIFRLEYMVRGLGYKAPGCEFESGSCLCLWVVVPHPQVTGMTSAEAEEINQPTNHLSSIITKTKL